MSDPLSYSTQPTDLGPSLEELTALPVYVDKFPPSEPFWVRSEKVVYSHSFERFRIILERTSDIGYGLWREGKLAEHGKHGADMDSKAFAKNLVESIADHLSIRNLHHLKAAIEVELLEQENSRRRAMTRILPLNF